MPGSTPQARPASKHCAPGVPQWPVNTACRRTSSSTTPRCAKSPAPIRVRWKNYRTCTGSGCASSKPTARRCSIAWPPCKVPRMGAARHSTGEQAVLEQLAAARRAGRRFQPQVSPGGLGGNAPARGALQKPRLNQKRFNHVFNGVALFANGCGQAVDPHRATVELVHDGFEQLAVHEVEPHGVNLEHGE